jgi:methylated-DNA-[protein]-cysteine S-methyltransferase
MPLREGACRLGRWTVQVTWDDDIVYRLMFSGGRPSGEVPPLLAAYCLGEPVDLRELKSPVTTGDSTFARIYRIVRDIPYGTTASYGEIARKAGTAPRAVGHAMRRNPTPLVVPCHRVISADGSLRGFGPGLDVKEAILRMEGAIKD